MADKSPQLVLEALSRALSAPTGLPLYASKTTPGLFQATAAARQVAQQCKDGGLLQVMRTETRGKAPVEICALTEKGLAQLLQEVSPRTVLEALLHALEAHGARAGDLVDTAKQTQTALAAIKSAVEKVLAQLQQPSASPAALNGHGADFWTAALVTYLADRHASGATQDCPLPELYRRACETVPNLSIGRFHDGLRRLHEHEQIYLHPWTGPLYDLPEPACALLVGHEVAYYASIRQK